MGLRRIVLGVVVVGAVMVWASHAYATALGKTFSQHNKEAQTVSGFAISNVGYALDPMNPGMIRAIGFDLDGPASDVRAKVRSAARTYSICINTIDFHWFCPIAEEAAEADALAVIAVQ